MGWNQWEQRWRKHPKPVPTPPAPVPTPPPPVPTPVPVPPVSVKYTVTYQAPGSTIPSLSFPAGTTFKVAAIVPQVGFSSNGWDDGMHAYQPGDTYTMPAANVTLIGLYTSSGPTPTPVPPPPVVTPPTPTPPPVVTPPTSFVIPPVAAGFKRVLSESWTSPTLNLSLWDSFYNGRSGGAQPGFFVASHASLLGDGWLRLKAYQDPTGLKQCYQYDATIANTINQYGGSGLQSAALYPITMNLAFICKWDTLPGMTPICLLMGRPSAGVPGWPPEIDIAELNAALKGGVPQPGMQSFRWTSNSSVQKQWNLVVMAGVDLSKEHLWTYSGTPTGTTTIVYDAAGKVAATCTSDFSKLVPATYMDQANPYGFTTPQFVAFQHQTGDPGNPANDASVTAANPITMYVGPVAVDIPG